MSGQAASCESIVIEALACHTSPLDVGQRPPLQEDVRQNVKAIDSRSGSLEK